MSRSRKLAILSSAVWLLLISGVGISAPDGALLIILFGLLPITLIWGIWWISRPAVTRTTVDIPTSIQATHDAPVDPSDVQNSKEARESDAKKKVSFGRRLVISLVFIVSAVLSRFAVEHLIGRPIAVRQLTSAIDNETFIPKLLEGKSLIEVLRESHVDSAPFKTGYRTTTEAAYASNFPGSKLSVADIHADDFGDSIVIAATIVGTASLSANGNPQNIFGKNIKIYQASGLSQIESLCVGPRTCPSLRDLTDRSVSTVRNITNNNNVEKILAAEATGRCSTENQSIPYFGKTLELRTRICILPEGLIQSFIIFPNEQVAEMMKSMSKTDEGKRLLKSTLDN